MKTYYLVLQYGELQRDDAKQTRILYNEWKRGARSYMPQRGRDVVIPEHLGILQTRFYKKKEKAASIKNQTPTLTQHKYLLNQVIPKIQRDTFIPVQYVIVKPWLRLDVECSQDIEYWSFNSKNMSFLNHLYNVRMQTRPYIVCLLILSRIDYAHCYTTFLCERNSILSRLRCDEK